MGVEAARTRASAVACTMSQKRADFLHQIWHGLVMRYFGLAVDERGGGCGPRFVDIGILVAEIIRHAAATRRPDESSDACFLRLSKHVSSAFDVDMKDDILGYSVVSVGKWWNYASSVDHNSWSDAFQGIFDLCRRSNVSSQVDNIWIRVLGRIEVKDCERPFRVFFLERIDDG